MTYNVCCGMLNLSQSMSAELHLICVVYMKKRTMFLDLYFRYCVYEIFRPSASEQASENSIEAT